MRALLVFSLIAAAASADLDCKNGGEVVKNKDDVEVCNCPSYWENGDDEVCEEIKCVNGGYEVTADRGKPSERKACYCPKGYYGVHCDAVKPSRPIGNEFETKKTFNLYIHNELTDWYGKKALQRIKNTTSAILEDYEFKYFNLYESQRGASSAEDTFDNKSPNMGLSDFLSALSLLNPETTKKYTCDRTTAISYEKLLANLKMNKIEDSVILMYTQYPPKNNQKDLTALKEYLRAFRIKLNVLIGADDILLDCNDKNHIGVFDELIDLAHFTDGEVATFLIEDDDSPDELLPAFIRSSALPQSHSRAASEDCNGLALKFQTDPYPNTYYIAVRSKQGAPATVTGTCSSGGQLSIASPSFYGEFTLYSILSGAQQNCTLSVTTKKSGCLATVFSVGGEKDVDSFELFHSFSTTDDMDTDSIHAFKDEDFYLSLHIKVSDKPKYPIVNFTGIVVVNNEDEQQIFEKNLVRRSPAVFEYISSDAFTCPANSSSWIQLKLEGLNVKGETLAVLDRIIPLNCEERPVPNKPAVFRSEAAEATLTKPMLAVLFSNSLSTSQFSRFILETVDDDNADRFSKFGYLRFDSRESPSFAPTDNFDDFKKSCYDHAPDTSIDYSPNLMNNVEALTSSSDPNKVVTSDSLVSIAVRTSMASSKSEATNLAKLANLGARLLIWGDSNVIQKVDAYTLNFYTRMAAASAGHALYVDMTEFDDDDEFFISKALRAMYSSGPSQRLLAFSNLNWPASPTTTQSVSLGSVQVPETESIFVSITLNVDDTASLTVAPFMMSLVLDNSEKRIVMNLENFTSYGPKSNLYTATIPVQAGSSYESSITILAMTSYIGAHVRFWTMRQDDEIIPSLTYANFGEAAVQPDDFIGAALRVPGEADEKIKLRILGPDGTEANRLDHNQEVTVMEGVAHFVPYFCSAPQSMFLDKDTYTIEVTRGDGFKYFRPMLCSHSTNAAECSNVRNDNVYCAETSPPFHRGPSKKLIDCSGVGQVYYTTESGSENGYKCKCDQGFSGQSCEQTECVDIFHLPGERDSYYRTLSFVFIGPSGEDACSDMVMYYAQDAKKIFASSAYSNLWQYTFSVYFTDGTSKTLYRGPSYESFMEQFDGISDKNEDFDPDTFCGTGKNIPTDMNDVLNLAVESVGRNSRGIVLFYASQSFAERVNQLENIIVDNSYYQTVQSYQQHVYMISPTITSDIIALTTASGGVAMKVVDDFGVGDTAFENLQQALENIITSQIGWAAVSTSLKDATWKVSQNSEIFVTAVCALGEDCEASITVTPTLTPLPSDSEDDDRTITRRATVPADTAVSVTFTNLEKLSFSQIVILTKDKPISHALIGQGQSNTDKHAAGATNTSDSAVHVSFDSAFTFSPINTNKWHQATRLNCDFSQEFVSSEQPFEEVGPSILEYKVVDEANKEFSLAVPLVVTETINCVHGTFSTVGSYCECDRADAEDPASDLLWSGPTCSQPACADGGKLNSHGDHCDCTGAKAGGPFCRG